jgi:hypothetical protein
MPYDDNGNLILAKIALDSYSERYFQVYWRLNPVNSFGATHTASELAPPEYHRTLVKFKPGAAAPATRAGAVQGFPDGLRASEVYNEFEQRVQSFVDDPGQIYAPDSLFLPEDHPGLQRFAGIWLENVTVNGTGWNSLVKVNLRKGGVFEYFGPRYTTGLLGTVEITGPGASYWQVHQSPITGTNRLEVYVKRNMVGQNIPATTFKFIPNYQQENPNFPAWNGSVSFPEQGPNCPILQVASEHYADWQGSSALIPPDNMTFQRCFTFWELLP